MVEVFGFFFFFKVLGNTITINKMFEVPLKMILLILNLGLQWTHIHIPVLRHQITHVQGLFAFESLMHVGFCWPKCLAMSKS